MPKLKTDVVLISDGRNSLTNNFDRLSGAPFLIQGPGEYEIKQIFISSLNAGVADQAQDTIFYLETENLSIGHLGHLNHSLSNEQLEVLEGVDLLFLPVSSLSVERRAKIISQVEPRIIIPMLYKLPKIKEQLEPLDNFLKEMSIKQITPQDKLKITRKELPEDKTQIIQLNPNV